MRLVLGVLALSALGDLLSLYLGKIYFEALERWKAGEDVNDEWVAVDETWGALGNVQFLLTIACAITFFLWQYRIVRNLPALFADGRKFTPGWAVAWWFFPIANLWKPYQAMREAWRASSPRLTSTPTDWKKEENSAMLPLWWALWIVSNVLGAEVTRLSFRADTTDEYITLNEFALAFSGVNVLATFAAMYIVYHLTMRLHARAEVVFNRPIAGSENDPMRPYGEAPANGMNTHP
ncbi:MAG: DUF4328 domain-containing protein [Planctomycetes bacterium]|nr:DUF4328 domain-containing protein [Planctomycetota bacterium]